MCLLAICMSSLEKNVCLGLPLIFLIGLFVVFILSCMNYLCILESNQTLHINAYMGNLEKWYH